VCEFGVIFVAARVVVDLVLGWQYVLATVDGFMDFIMRRVVVAVLVLAA
jgi:hypothetical protein